MKAIYSNTLAAIFAVALVISFNVSCKKTDELEMVRLFRPVIAGQMISEGNWISAAWQPIKSATSYTLEVSKDTFKTIDRSIQLDSTNFYIADLLWDQAYQLQVKANASDSVYNSKFSFLGEIKTPRFPSILNVPDSTSEVGSDQVKITWTNDNNPVTKIRLLKADSSLVTEVNLSAQDIENQYKVILDLQPLTDYIIYLYSSATVRGWANFRTKEALSGNIIDLSGIVDRPGVMIDTIPYIESGSIILLKKGMVYSMSSTSLDKSLTIRSKEDLSIPDNAFIRFTSNFTFASGANVEYVRFENLILRSDNYAGRYIFNVNSECNVGEISFNNCIIGAFRGVARFQNRDITVNQFTVNNCMVDSIKDYGVINADGAASLVENITLSSSTFFKSERIARGSKSSRDPLSFTITDCTFNEAPWGGSGTGTGNELAEFGGKTFVNGIVVKNCIFGPGWMRDRDNPNVRGFVFGSGNFDGSNNFATSDYELTAGEIPGTTKLTKSSTELFLDPLNGNFSINDATFQGRSSSGDPRWRM